MKITLFSKTKSIWWETGIVLHSFLHIPLMTVAFRPASVSQQFAVFQVCVWRWVGTQPCPTLRDPMDCILPGSSVHGILQAQEYWSERPFHIPGDLLDPGIEPVSLESPALAGGVFITRAKGYLTPDNCGCSSLIWHQNTKDSWGDGV